MARKKNDSSEIWAIGYGTHLYNKVNWWSHFLVSRHFEHKQVRSGQAYLVSTSHCLPNKWTLIYCRDEEAQLPLQDLKKNWQNLGEPKMVLFTDSIREASLAESFFSASVFEKKIKVENSI